MITAIIGLIILIGDIWAIVETVQSNSDTFTKVLWIAFIIIFPLIGLVVWYFVGPRSIRLM